MGGTVGAANRVWHDYRTVSVYPQPEDILPNIQVQLSRNVTLGNYIDVWHYLSTHFHLLREDFMAPLRSALSAYKEALRNGRSAKVGDFRVYLNTKFIKWKRYLKENFTEAELEKMDVSYIGNRVNRKMFKLLVPGKCQQKAAGGKEPLIYGTLLCFSSDNFETVFFGVVTMLQNVKKGFVSVELFESEPFIYEKSYTMLECMNYFHVHKVVLLALQNLNPLNCQLPMKSYLVNTEKKITAPSYLTRSSKYTLANTTFKVLDLAMWPSKESLSLNTTQYEAFRNALTSELAIIQGPPGTGKTYVTVKIAEALIKNYDAISATMTAGPILVVAFTNHALDQFLEALIPFTNRIIRVGQRSTNPKVQSFVYSGCKRDGGALAEYYKVLEQILEKIDKQEKEIEKALTPSYIIYDIRIYLANTLSKRNSWPILVSDEEFLHCLMGESTTEDQRKRRWEMASLIINPAKVCDRLYIKGIPKEVDDLRYIQWRYSYRKQHVNLYKTIDVTKSNSEKLPYNSRWILYFHWLTTYITQSKTQLKIYRDSLAHQWDQLQKYKQWQDSQTVSKAVVVGMTTTVAAQKQHLLASLRCPIVIVEEAAEVLESHIVVSLTQHCQHLILVGDHQQLRPKTYDYQIGTKYGLDISLFERMLLNKIQCTTLDVQHRMRPEISRLIVPAIYPRVKDHSSVCNLPDVVGMHHNVFFIHHTDAESAPGTSRANLNEVKRVVDLASHLVKQGHKQSEITILATYKAQVEAIQKLVTHVALRQVRVTTVDNFQGEENQIVLLSLVRNNRDSSIGFLAEMNRVCVALSRARKGFYMFGNMDILCRKSKLWSKIRKVLISNNQLGDGLDICCSKRPENSISNAALVSLFAFVVFLGCGPIYSVIIVAFCIIAYFKYW